MRGLVCNYLVFVYRETEMGTTSSFSIGGIDFSETSGDRKKWDPKKGEWVNQNEYNVNGFKFFKNKNPSGGKKKKNTQKSKKKVAKKKKVIKKRSKIVVKKK